MSHVQNVRAASADRWQEALTRAFAGGLEVFTTTDGERFVTSGSRLDLLHRTDGAACTCHAAQAGDPVCAHRAVVRFAAGQLVSTLTLTPAQCPSCTNGAVESWVSGHVAGAHPCTVCAGAGHLLRAA